MGPSGWSLPWALLGCGLVVLCVASQVSTEQSQQPAKRHPVKKRILLDQTPVLPDKVRLLAECSGTGPNCTRTCPQNYTLDSRQQYCRPKRAGSGCPRGYVQRAGGGGCTLEDIQCPPGSTREGSRCVIRSYGCPSGYVARGNNCVRESICPSGFRWENGFCLPAGARMFCPPGFTEQPGTGNCAPSACADCCDCQDETVPTVCPAGYGNQWGRCVRLLQASPDLRIQSVVYRLPVECHTAGETFNEGRCEAWNVVGRPACRSGGHLYNGSCVEVARCQRGTLNNACSCEFEQQLQPTCSIGKLHDQTTASGSCIVSNVHCRPPARLRNGVCVRESKARSTCPEGVPFMQDYCAIDVPRCPPGFSLDEQGLCKKLASCRMDCGPYQKRGRWCGLAATCPDRFSLNEDGYCVLETVQPAFSCPPGTVERGRECVSESPLCRSNYRYHADVNLCVRCDEQPIRCPRGNLTEGRCLWTEPACPDGYEWSEGMCVRNTTRERYRCRKGYEYENLCVHGELSCPSGHELYGESCIVKEDIHCPDGAYPHEGRCTVALECPENFQAGPDVCVREHRRHINATRLVCPTGFDYDGEACVVRTVVEASVHRRELECPEGYERQPGGDCSRTIRTFAVCPPRTIYTERNDRCYCEVDLTCPHGYERTGADCTFRAVGYSPFVNFLNPCYGAFCGNLNCLSQCSNPPCLFEHCSHPAGSPMFNLGGFGPHGPNCGSNDCPPQETIGLVCPPGYERVNSSCFAYYDKRCPEGYEPIGGDPGAGCVRQLLVSPVCPPGYGTRVGTVCLRASCPTGYKLTNRGETVCEKREFRSPKPCPPGTDFFRGACYRRSACRNGTIDGEYCVEREFVRPSCPAGYVQRADDCTVEGSCRADSIYIDGTCVRFTEPAGCPDGTYRLGKLCVYPDPPQCEDRPFVATECTSEVDARGRCWKSSPPACPKGYQLVDNRCVSCQTEPPTCPQHMTIQHGELCVAERIVCPVGYFLRVGQCIKLHVSRPRCPSEEYGLCDGFCIAPHVHECKRSEYHAPVCARGFQHHGKCVLPGRCEPEYTLLQGECHLRSFFDPSCHGKGSRVGDLCLGGTPQCPPNYALMGGRCWSGLIENAQCSGGATCSESFCHVDPPRCTTAGAVFDGHVCRQLVTSQPSCPTGTNPDRYDTNFCQLKTEKATYNCPDEYHYQGGVCLRKLYKTPTCPAGYKLRHGVCYKRVCTRMSSRSVCSDSAASTVALTCTQCLNGTSSISVSSSSGGSSSVDSLTYSGQGPPPTSTATAYDSGSNDLCCSVFSPRICEPSGVCHHERETICGSFCFTEDDKIYLTVAQCSQIGTKLYMAPRRTEEDGDDADDDDDYNDGDEPSSTSSYDFLVTRARDQSCFRCVHDPVSCPRQCNTYDCQSADEDCHFIDASTFCAQYRGGKICKSMHLPR